MAYDLEEQEQIDTLKAWWKQYGNLVTWLLIAALSSFAGWTAWTNYQHGQSSQASAIYDEVQRAAGLKDNAKVQGATANLVTKFAGTSYASMAALAAAKTAFDASDLKTAKVQLNWVVEHGYTKEFKALAKLRLTSILLDEKNYDEALKVLGGEFPAEFDADVLDRKADVLVAQDKLKEARETYKSALDKMGEKHVGKQLVQIKLDALGGAPDTKVAVTTDKK
ncbi:tetratricopeptide repeat protein [Undibacterium seohonense]|jgi:predicted negative regulator of RcsB-dependent stress response|uniref:Tetratricopeptide repeat protein n=1 Tax=Undibacterium seohonense TaxID=1344950 RepID=A0ABR6X751_9BURK|nr:tetratricopeptide repeat protein [Undibacterium seohonense]MBC3808719.1 tetratricopeptide repeat protein [Undibacterium seohonense]